MNRTPVTVADVLGVPLLPPGRVTAAGNRVRGVLGRLHGGMAPPPARIMEGLFGMLEHRALVLLCRAGVPDALTRPTPVPRLAARLDADPVRLERLLRYAATKGWIRLDRRGRVSPTRVTAFLRSDHPGGWRAWVEFAGGEEITAAVGALSVTEEPADAFAAVNGTPFFDWMAHHPDRWSIFDRAMGAGGRMHALTLAAALDWSEDRRVCDVGGGTGQLLSTLLDLVPSLDGTLLDLPEVVARAVPHPRLQTQGGDAFTHVPEGFDTYLLVNVLHDWDDADAVRILTRVAQATGSSGRVVVVESEYTAVPHDALGVSADLLMAALTDGGRERGIEGFVELGRSAGLRHERAVRLASGDLAHVYHPAGR
jgi:SAM-dependent methyltransferase